MDESGNSKVSRSDDEPLIPDFIDEHFYKQILEKIPQIIKFIKQKDNQVNADHVQRLLLCANRIKSQYNAERKKREELEEEINNLNVNLKDAETLNQLNQATISELRSVIENAWCQKDAAHIREQAAMGELAQAKELIEQLQDNIKSLSDPRTTFRQKQDDSKDRERLQNELNDLKKRLQMQRNYASELEDNIQKLDEKNKNLIKALDETATELHHSKKRIDALNKEVEQFKLEVFNYTEQTTTLKQQAEKLTKMKVRQNLQILSLKTNMEHLSTQYNAVCNKLAKLTVDLEYATQERDKCKRRLAQKTALLKMRQEEIIKYRQENSKLNKLQDSASRKYTNIEGAKKSYEEENLRLKTQLNTQEKEYDAIRRLLQQIECKNNQLVQERDSLKRDLLLEHNICGESQQLLQESHYEIRSLKDSLVLQERKYKKLLAEIMQLNVEKNKKVEETQALSDKIDTMQDKIHLKESYEAELKRTISDAEADITKLQAQHNNLINEHNTLLRSNHSLSEEISKCNSSLDEKQNAIENLKNKLSLRDSDISKFQLQIDKMEKERRLLKNELRYTQLQHQHIKVELLEKKKCYDTLSKSLLEDQKTITRLKRDLDNLINEKNSLFSSLSKKDEELQQLQKEFDNLHKSHDLLQSEAQKRNDDFNLMIIEIKNLTTERDVLRKDREGAADLRHELLQMHRRLNQERIKARALQDEMLTPMNVHRWRTLKGKDPEKMDLIQKLQVLRKQLLNYNVAALEQDRALRESQSLYVALKDFMAKLPSIKIKAELNEVKASLTRKDKRLKSLMAELNTKSLDEKITILEVEGLKGSLNKTKEQLLEERKMKERLLVERQVLLQMHIQTECLSASPHLERLAMVTN